VDDSFAHRKTCPLAEIDLVAVEVGDAGAVNMFGDEDDEFFAELWMVHGYRDYDFDDAVEQLTHLWANALGIQPSTARSRSKTKK
jgi:hypothetical protein